MSQSGSRPQGAQYHGLLPTGWGHIGKVLTLGLFLILTPTLTLIAQDSGASDGTPKPLKAVVLRVDGTEREVTTRKDTVLELLHQEGCSVSQLDRVDPERDSALTDGMVIVITRVEIKRYETPYTIEPPVEYRWLNRDAEDSVALQQGEPGRGVDVWRAWMKDGVCTLREWVGRRVIVAPKPTIILRGQLPSRGATVKVMEATAYSPEDPGCGSSTRIGLPAARGVIAVDPRVIPLRSRVYVEGYGMAIAADTGGAIKGNIIDVCFPTAAEARRWGRKQVRVVIL